MLIFYLHNFTRTRNFFKCRYQVPYKKAMSKSRHTRTYLMLGSKSSSSAPFIVSPTLLAFHLSPSFLLSCKKKNNKKTIIIKTLEKSKIKSFKRPIFFPKKKKILTSVMRCTSRCLRASSFSRSTRSFSATRARSSASSCSLNANSNCETLHVNIVNSQYFYNVFG